MAAGGKRPLGGLAGVAEMLAIGRDRSVGVAPEQGGSDAVVVVEAHGDHPRRLGGDPADVEGDVVKPGRHGGEEGVAGGGVDGLVEGEVEHPEADRVVEEGMTFRCEALELSELVVAAPLGGEPDQVEVDRGARLEMDGDVVVLDEHQELQRRDQPPRRQVGDGVAAALAALEHAEHGQRLQRFAERRPADAERHRHLLLGRQLVAGLEVAALDQRQDAVRHLLGDRAPFQRHPLEGRGGPRPLEAGDQRIEGIRRSAHHSARR